MDFFKWTWDKTIAFLIGILINLITPTKTLAVTITIFVMIVFMGLTYILYKRYPKLLGIKTTYVATGIIFDENFEKVLLSYHKRQKMWIPPGGHIINNECLHETVVKLIKEESGFDVEFFKFHDSNKFDYICEVVPQPFRVQVEKQIPSEGHDTHYDFLYIFTLKENKQSEKHSLESKWFDVKEIDGMAGRRQTYKDVGDIIKVALEIINSTKETEGKK